MTARELAKVAVNALEDRKAEDVTVIDISEISPIADYFIIANGTNQNQLQAMRDAADEALYKAGVKVQQVEGNQNSTWILMDYGDIIIHIFSKEDRLFYDLERTWRDGKIIDTILNSLSNLLAGTGNVLFVVVMYIVQSVLTLLVPSSSGLAALTMPIMSSLCDLHGANPEAAVTVLQYANQLTNMMSPVAGTTVAGLAVCRISFSQWWKTFWKVFVVLTIVALVFCAISAGM